MRKHYAFLFFLATGLLDGCSAFQSLTERNSPREIYADRLEKSDLTKSIMAKRWIKAGNPSSHDSVNILLPWSETGFFSASDPQARFFRFEGRAGQIVALSVKIKSTEGTKLFIDLFIKEQQKWEPVAWADSLLTLSYELTKNETCLIRIQPELLTDVFYAVEIGTTAALIIPVKGATNKSIGSFYNDPRTINGKIRKHEGVDIFAQKGTPVIAPVDGFVSRVTTNTLGGKVVWMTDTKRNQSYYFAHLDSQIAIAGTTVKQGAVLGTVGNTGNAKFTPSHLHFGVYQNTSIDPIDYLKGIYPLTGNVLPDTLFRYFIVRVNQKNSLLYSGPSKDFSSQQIMPKDTWLKVLAQGKTWYRVITAIDQEGFIERSKVTPATTGNFFAIEKPRPLLLGPDRNAVPKGLVTGKLEGLASYKTFRYIRTAKGELGWIDLAPLNQGVNVFDK